MILRRYITPARGQLKGRSRRRVSQAGAFDQIRRMRHGGRVASRTGRKTGKMAVASRIAARRRTNIRGSHGSMPGYSLSYQLNIVQRALEQ